MKEDTLPPIKYGVYMNHRTASLILATQLDKLSSFEWMVDKGVVQNHPLLRMKIHRTQSGTGKYFFWKAVGKKSIYLGEL